MEGMMKLPVVNLFTRLDQVRLKERRAKQLAEHHRIRDAVYFEKLSDASRALRVARLSWAAGIGTHLWTLMRHLAQLHEDGFIVRDVTMSWEIENPLSFRNSLPLIHAEENGTTPPPTTAQKRLEAWEKICGIWILPPELTTEEIAHIESLADEIFRFMTAPESTKAPSIF